MIVFSCTDKGGTSCSSSITGYSSADFKSGRRPRQDVSTNKSICELYPLALVGALLFSGKSLKLSGKLHLYSIVDSPSETHDLPSILLCVPFLVFLGHGLQDSIQDGMMPPVTFSEVSVMDTYSECNLQQSFTTLPS